MRVNASRAVEGVRVEGGDERVASHVGTHLLGQLARRLGIVSALERAMASTVERRPGQQRGRLLTQVALMLATGGRCVSDLAVLRNQPLLFGNVASDATVCRTFHRIDEDTLARLREAEAR